LIGLCAVPLGICSTQRGGAYPFFIAVGLPGVFYAVLNLSDNVNLQNYAPPEFLAWLPNAMLLGFLFFLKKIPDRLE
jgi:lipopolysaccharide export LptBFGC system permease protein LptF